MNLPQCLHWYLFNKFDEFLRKKWEEVLNRLKIKETEKKPESDKSFKI